MILKIWWILSNTIEPFEHTKTRTRVALFWYKSFLSFQNFVTLWTSFGSKPCSELVFDVIGNPDALVDYV